MTDGDANRQIAGDGESGAGLDDVEPVDPEEIAALDDAEAPTGDGPDPERFDGFVGDVDTGRVVREGCPDEDVPIDASMDELFAER